MKKINCLLLLLLIACCQVYAGNRTEEQMKEIAANALSSKTRRAASVADLKECLSLSKLKVYGYESGGFAVIPSDDNYESVIGISASTFDGPMPDGFKWWIEAVNEIMEKGQGPMKTRAKIISDTGVGPLMTTQWGQDRPFNNQCVLTVEGQEYRLLTGCIATAMAQVMNYYKYPIKGKGENSYTIHYNDLGVHTFSANFEESYYDWDHMLDDYSAYRYSNTEDQYTDAVSKLMSDCGIAVNMKYTTYSSGTYAFLIPIALKDYFSYSFIDNTKTIYYRTNYSNSDDWMDIVYNALNNNHPIIYCGSSGLSGHCFVIHGYEPDGKVIVNWGWNGSYDGSFMIDMLNPGNHSYNDNQNMVIPIPEEQPVVSNTYKLTYLVDGEIYKEYELNVGDAISPEPVPTKNGYTFSGWSDIPSTMPDHDVAVTGYFYNSLPSVNTVTAEIDGIYYILIGKSKTAEVTSSPNKYSGDITIPKTVDYEGFTYQVTQIGKKAFSYCYNLSSVSIPDGVTKIGNNAFELCKTISSIILPSSVNEIGQSAFYMCKKLSSFIIPDGVTTIKMETFDQCSGLKSIKIPETVTSIENYGFAGCSALESISLPSNLTDLGGTLGACFYECKSLSSIVIPDKLTAIGLNTFYGCTNLKTVTIGKSITNIYSKAFAECKSLESVICLAENPPTANSNAFENSYIEHVNLYVPDASVSSYLSASPWNQFKAVKSVSEYTPDNQQAPTETAEINGIYYNLIGKSRTAEVTSSPNKYSGDVTIPESVEYEGFTYQVTQIGEKAFYYCYNLSSVSIPDGVTKIGNNAFELCKTISSIILPSSVNEIGQSAFYMCKKLSSFIIPDGVTTIKMETFDQCSGLKSIKIPETVTSIENYGFAGCSALESISLPQSLTKIGGSCFDGCTSLTSILIPDELTSIGSSSFSNCTSLASIVIPDKVISIGSSAFYGCTNLKTMTIGESVTNIYSKAFAECKSLENVISMAENPPTANSDAFENSYIEYATLYVPENSVINYSSEEPWSHFGQIVVFSGYLNGDVNGDGKMDIADAICIVNYLMGNPPAGFNAAAADVNGDGQVTIADAVIVVNVIMNP